MRSAILTILVLLALGGAFAVFVLTQPPPPPVVKSAVDEPTEHATMKNPGDGDDGSVIGAGDGAWIQTYDKTTGVLTSEFRAARYDPPQDGVVYVDDPKARFYTNSGQVLTVGARDGRVVMPESTKRSDRIDSIQGQPPSRGVLNDVTLELFTNADADTPSLTCRLPILAFDNETLLLNTVQTQIDGHDIPPDRVPVTVRGDYEFDGQGLVIRWNARDQRLDYLEIAHGQRLLVRDPSAFSGGTVPGATEGTPVSSTTTGIVADEFASVDSSAAVVTARNDAATLPVATAPDAAAGTGTEAITQTAEEQQYRTRQAARRAAAAASQAVAYRATFHESVIIFEGKSPVGNAEQMQVTFTFGGDEKADTSPANRPTKTRPSTTSHPLKEPSTQATAEAVSATAATSSQATPQIEPHESDDIIDGRSRVADVVSPKRSASSKSPARPKTGVANSAGPSVATSQGVGKPQASKPAEGNSVKQEPLEVRWTGKLIVVPIKFGESELISTADRTVQLTGRPVTLTREGASVSAGFVRASTAAKRFSAAGYDAEKQITFRDASGTTLRTKSIDIVDNLAVMRGSSVAESISRGTDGRPSKLITRWTERATINLTQDADGQRLIESAALEGSVGVDHPQFKLVGDRLDLAFDTTAAVQPALRSADARGHVVATSVSSDASDRPPQTISADRLTVTSGQDADGELYPQTLTAWGDVSLADDKQSLRADTVVAFFKPGAAGGVAADNRAADGKVDINRQQPAERSPANADEGALASTGADALTLDRMTAEGSVRLMGEDDLAASAKKLSVSSNSVGRQVLELTGKPAAVRRGGSTLTGDNIVLQADGSAASVDGAGKITGRSNDGAFMTAGAAVSKAADGTADVTDESSRPIEITWTKQLQYNAENNQLQISGDVSVVSKSADGSTDKAKSQRLTMTLADTGTPLAATKGNTDSPAQHRQPDVKRPAEKRPTEQLPPAVANNTKKVAEGTSTRRVSSPAKQIRALRLDGGVEVSSILPNPSNADKPTRAVHLYAPAINVDIEQGQGIGAISIPSAGRMLYEDNRAAVGRDNKELPPGEASGKAGPAADKPQDNALALRGATAIAWNKSMTYEPASSSATLLGEVVVVHQAADGEPFRMTAERMIATLMPADGDKVVTPTTTRPAETADRGTKPTAATPVDRPQQIKQVTADGGVTITTSRVRLDAVEAIFDPASGQTVARGTADRPVEVYDEGGISGGSFEEVTWDLNTNRPTRMKNVRGGLRR